MVRIACFVLCLAGWSAVTGLAAASDVQGPVRVVTEEVGKMPDGAAIEQFTLSNARGMQVRVMTYGATLTGVLVPDRDGHVSNVTLYLDTCSEYLQGHPLFGSVVGRFANRISGAQLTIDGQRFELTKNLGRHHIHGGNQGFHTVNWQARPLSLDDRAGVEMTHTSPDGHEGYPGTLQVRLQYMLTEDNQLLLEYWAKTDKPTHLNLTNHAYWNLAGAGSGNVLGHVLQINADATLVADAQRFPTGEIRPVAGTPLDFRAPCPVGRRIDQLPDQNYDDCYVLNKARSDELTWAARVVDPHSGRAMEVYTTQPSVQLYTAKGLSDRLRASSGVYGPYHGLCLETQHFPDAPNQSQFPTTLLRPGDEFHQLTIHKFFTQ
jgi:aldose 1-epimerase